MTSNSSARQSFFIVVTFYALLGTIAILLYLGTQSLLKQINTLAALNQVQIIYSMKHKAEENDLPEAATCLAYVVNFYPSGTKQSKGSALDSIVERCRSEVIQDMLADMRERSTHDFGEDPRSWIDALRND